MAPLSQPTTCAVAQPWLKLRSTSLHSVPVLACHLLLSLCPTIQSLQISSEIPFLALPSNMFSLTNLCASFKAQVNLITSTVKSFSVFLKGMNGFLFYALKEQSSYLVFQ